MKNSPQQELPSLDELGHKYGTDKRSNGCHNYLKYYEMFLSSLRDERFNLLELGVWHGDSLRMWSEYFQNARIIGFDYDDVRQHEDVINRIHIVRGDQTDKGRLIDLFDGADLKVIIDDAGHQGHAQIISFTTLFPLMQSGGLYCIEDLLCSYHHWADKDSFISYIKRYLVDAVQMNGVIPHDKLCSDKREQVKLYDGDYFAKNIEWIWLGMGLVIIKKL